jgi:serine/threonine protein kinase/tetratricopeptide (TPR) repeat protein
LPDLLTRLQAALADRYRLYREVGHGGMATVYLADDVKHSRRVAVKVLQPELATVVGPDRFVQEIKVAAGLTHPHIIPLLDSAAAAGCLYYVMPFIDGESLRQRLNREIQLPLEEAVQLARDVASGLSFAHAHGIVHRDVKPENILVTGGTAVLADFGIALVLEAAPEARLTTTGLALGTPTYMSPEQAHGQHLDARSDIYSLGCVLYEMLAGQPPFQGATAQSLLARHAIEPVPSIQTVRPTVPEQLELAIKKALAKVPADRFRTADEFASAITRAVQIPTHQAQPTQHETHERKKSVAVLPFVNIGSSDNEYFADGLTEELIAALATVEGLRVVARTSSFAFKGKQQDVRTVGNALSVGFVVEGSVRKWGDRGRLLVHLIDTSDGRQAWSASYDRSFGDVLAIQEELSKTIIDAVQLQIVPPSRPTISSAPEPADIEAYEQYLKGRFLWNKRTRATVERAISYFERAVAKAPSYAKAYVGTADCYIVLANTGVLTPTEGFSKAREAVQQALARDASLPEAHFSMANIAQSFDWNWDAAEAGFIRGLQLGPGYSTGHQWYGLHLAAMGRPKEAIVRLKAALHLDPLSPVIASSLGTGFYYARQPKEAIDAFLSALELDPEFGAARAGLGETYLMTNQREQGLRELHRAVEVTNRDSQMLARLASGYAFMGQTKDADRILEELHERSTTAYVPAYFLARIYANLQRSHEAFANLEKAYEQRSDWLMDLAVDPAFDGLRDTPRFRALLRTLRLVQPGRQ